MAQNISIIIITLLVIDLALKLGILSVLFLGVKRKIAEEEAREHRQAIKRVRKGLAEYRKMRNG